MKYISRLWFPVAVMATAASGVFGLGSTRVHTAIAPAEISAQDTVIYPHDGYKQRRGTLDLGDYQLADSLLRDDYTEVADTMPHLTARDTIKVPDSLRYTDPFRYRYYVALIDSLTHVTVCDSLRRSSDSLRTSGDTLIARYRLNHSLSDSIKSGEEYLKARLDSMDWRKVDSIYLADSAALAKARFEQWWRSLSRKEQKAWTAEQKLPIKLAQMDSLKKAKEKRQAEKDSITEATPRILETYYLPDSLLYKRIIHWTVDQDFHKLTNIPIDTTYNYHLFDDKPWIRKDVNATWLGVDGSPVQMYNWFKRETEDGVDFYNALQAWTYNPSTLPHYNSKTPYTELAYYGTLLASRSKEIDDIHFLTTQNILPSLNFSILYDRFGGGGYLENQETKNKTFAVDVNYLGKKYMAHGGYIYNMVQQGENGGIQDNMWIRDTVIEAREIDIALKKASSLVKKNTLYLDQQLRIPFNFINRIRSKKDSTIVFNADSLDRDITTAFLGHSTEFTQFKRQYKDEIGLTETFAREFYNNQFNWNPTRSADSLGVTKFDNKVFMRLQPWAADAAVSKLDVGVGDLMMHYFDSTSIRPSVHKENSLYAYAGAEGQLFRGAVNWDARGKFFIAGIKAADFSIEANAGMNIYPFRRAKKSPISLTAHFETSLQEPNYYQKYIQTNHFKWENSFGKISTTKIQARLSIPHWKLDAGVGYALLANNIYYDNLGVARQNANAMSVLSADLRKDFAFGPFHLDNKALFQLSSDQEVLPLPTLALNLRWYFQFVLQKDETKTKNILVMQVGANAFCNTAWYAPAWNPALGVFHNQNKELYNNGPFFDVFINAQWKRAVIFIKYQNAGGGWPMRKADYFSADHYIVGTNGMNGLKLGLYWPFYTQPHHNKKMSSGASGGGARSSGGSSGSSSASAGMMGGGSMMGGGAGRGLRTADR
ncbi:MAG: putative porin [Bacteroidales bacterium]|nr:putative porin [Candidatus Cryptobacteroides choladohippi]